MKIAIGKHHILYLIDNRVYGSGDNFFGQIGTNNIYEEKLVLTKLKSVVDIACSENYSLVVTKNGRVYYLGYNRYHFSKNVMYLISNLKGIIKIASNNFSILAVDIFGQVYGFGNNGYGQLGLGHCEDKDIPVLIMSNVKEVSISRSHSLVLTNDNKVFGAGCNVNGQLGKGERFISKMSLVCENINQIAAGDGYSLMIDSKGIVICLGREFKEQGKFIAAGRDPVVSNEYVAASEDVRAKL